MDAHSVNLSESQKKEDREGMDFQENRDRWVDAGFEEDLNTRFTAWGAH